MASASAYNALSHIRPISSSAVWLICPSSHHENVLQGFSEMQQQAQMTDFNIKTQSGKSIPVHKILLYTSSDYFKSLFSSNMKETEEGELCLEKTSDNVAFAIINYFYGRQVVIELDEMDEFVDAVEMFQLCDLRSQLEKIMMRRVSLVNCLQWSILADRYGYKKLKLKTKEIIQTNFLQVCSVQKELELSQMMYLLQFDDLITVESDMKLKAAIDWVTWKEEERTSTFAQLIEQIDLKHCSLSYLKFVLEKFEGSLITDDGLRKKLCDCVGVTGSVQAIDASGGSKFIVLGGVNEEKVLIESMYEVDLTAGTVENIGNVAKCLLKHDPARCVASGSVFCGGGSVNNSRSYDGYIFNPITKHVSQLLLRCHPMVGSGAAMIGSKVYIIGGSKHSRDMLCFDLNTSNLRTCQPLKEGAIYPTVCQVEKRIYALSDGDDGDESDSDEYCPWLHIYDTESDVWDTVEISDHMSCTKGVCAVVAWNTIYFLGGADHICLSYNVTHEKFSKLARPKHRHFDGSAAHTDGKIALVGGRNSDKIEVYDIVRNTWEVSSLALPVKQSGHICINA